MNKTTLLTLFVLGFALTGCEQAAQQATDMAKQSARQAIDGAKQTAEEALGLQGTGKEGEAGKGKDESEQEGEREGSAKD